MRQLAIVVVLFAVARVAHAQPAGSDAGSGSATAVAPPAAAPPPASAPPVPGSDDCQFDFETSLGSGSGSGSAGSGAGSAKGSGSTGKGSAAVGSNAAIDVPIIDSAVPDAPAFAFLGVTPSQITQPQSARELAAAAAQVIDVHGVLHQGAAIEWTPYVTFAGSDEQLSDDTFAFWKTLQISIATSQAEGSGVSTMGSGMMASSSETDAAIGVRLTIWNPDDPKTQLSRTYPTAAARDVAGAAAKVLDASHTGPPTDVGTAKAIDNDQLNGFCKSHSTDPAVLDLEAKIATYKKQLAAATSAAKKVWNQNSFAVGAAIGEIFPTSNFDTHQFRGFAAWGTLSVRLGKYGQVIAMGRYHSDAKADTPGDTSLLGARVVFGTNSAVGFTEIAFNRLVPSGASSLADNWGQSTTGVEFKVSDQTWFVLAFGGVFDKANEQSDFFALSNLKWSIGQRTIKVGPLASPQ